MNLFFPLHYYLSSRYKDISSRVFYLIKYFGPYLILLHLTGETIGFSYLVNVILVFLSFYNTYEIFIFWNDSIDLPDHRLVSNQVSNSRFYLIKVIIWVIFKIVIFLIQPDLFWDALILESALAGIFMLHNLFYWAKPVTFYCLYVSKSIIFILPIEGFFEHENSNLYVMYALLFNLAYVPRYVTRKFLWANNGDGNRYKNRFLQAIVFKNLFLLALSFVSSQFIFILVAVDILTFFELVVRRIKRTTEY